VGQAWSSHFSHSLDTPLTRISHTEILNREKWVKSRLRVRFFGLTKKRWSVWAMFRDQKVPSAACGAITGQLRGSSGAPIRAGRSRLSAF
jgi:hypothetical protein